MKVTTQTIRSLAARFANDTGGAALLFYTAMVAVSMGIVGLSIDGGRLFNLNTELQNVADAAALAGAKELDGRADSITRATDRARNLLANDVRFSDGGSGALVATVTFSQTVGGPTTTVPQLARYIHVTTSSRTVAASFLRAVGATSDANTTARASAGSQYVACNVQPLMMCNPYEGSGGQLSAADRGRLFRLKQKTGNGQYFPGDFGLLDPPNMAPGSDPVAQNLAASSPNFCYTADVTVTPGGKTSAIQDGIGVRFDMPVSGNSAAAQALNAQPAPPVVIKGYRTNSCNFNNQNDAPLPRDSCMPPAGTPAGQSSNTCGPGGTDSNVGNADFAARMQTPATGYWARHHSGAYPGFASRFALYLQESGCDEATNACNSAAATRPPLSNGNRENPAPRCLPNTNGNLERRLIYVAIVNCSEYNVQGNASLPIIPRQYGKFFLTEPPDGGVIYAEFVQIYDVGDENSRLHHIVQLVR